MIDLVKTIKMAMDKIVKIANSKVDKDVINEIYKEKRLTTTVTNGTNWKDCSASTVFVGNQLRVYFIGTRKTASGTGNVTNETVCTVKIDTQNLIKNFFNVSILSGETGPLATFYTGSVSFSGNMLTFNVNMSATHSAVTQVNGYFATVVELNDKAFF